MRVYILAFFFFNDTATTEIYTLSLHDALPILQGDRFAALRLVPHEHAVRQHADERLARQVIPAPDAEPHGNAERSGTLDRKSTRLNSSHLVISYAVFCLKKKIYRDMQCVYHIE